MTEELLIFNLIRPREVLVGVLTFLRISALLYFLPIFGDSMLPVRVRLFMGAAIAYLLFSTINGIPQILSTDSFVFKSVMAFTLAVFKELFIGASIGFVAKISFEAVLAGANIVGYQMGFGMANFFMQDSPGQSTAFFVLHRLIVILLFFSLNLHHIFIQGLAYSFQVIPLGLSQIFVTDMMRVFIELSSNLFMISLQVSAPILVALLFAMAALGLVARAVPQMNVFTLSFPVSFFAGLMIYIACFPYLSDWMQEHFQATERLIIANLEGLVAPPAR